MEAIVRIVFILNMLLKIQFFLNFSRYFKAPKTIEKDGKKISQ
jgi:hypothetical protein